MLFIEFIAFIYVNSAESIADIPVHSSCQAATYSDQLNQDRLILSNTKRLPEKASLYH